MDMMPLEESFAKFSFLDLTCGAGQLLYTAMTAPYARDMRFFVGGVNLPAQLGSAKRLANFIYEERLADSRFAEVFIKKFLLVKEQEQYTSLHPFTHVFIDSRFTDVGWMRRIVTAINASSSVRFLLTSCGESDLRRYGLDNFQFRACTEVRVRGRDNRVVFLMYERKACYKKDAIGRLKKDVLFTNAMKAWSSRSTFWFQ